MNCYALTNKTKQNLLYSLHMGREKTPSSREIAVILDFRYNTARKILMGVIAATRNHDDVHVSVYGSHPNAPLQKGHPFRRPDGIISAYHATSRPLHPFLKSAPEAPIVFICNSVNEAPHKQCVFYCCDNTLVARAAAEVFRRHNLKNFAFVDAALPTVWSEERNVAFRKAIPADGTCATYDPKRDGILADWLKGLPKPCGVFTAHDERAMDVLEAACTADIDVPSTLEVVGVDNTDWLCELAKPSLTSVEINAEEAGHMAVADILRALDGRTLPATRKYGIKGVVERLSTADLRGHARRARLALDILDKTPVNRLSANALALSLGCSLRTLELDYRKTFGRAVRDDIIDRRLKEAARLLETTNLSIGDIAARIGAVRPNHIMTCFRKKFGLTMLRYRNNKPG